MIEAAPNPVTAVMRALADPTRRAVFERVFDSKEISVAELTRGSGVTQGAISQHLKSLQQAGLVARRAARHCRDVVPHPWRSRHANSARSCGLRHAQE